METKKVYAVGTDQKGALKVFSADVVKETTKQVAIKRVDGEYYTNWAFGYKRTLTRADVHFTPLEAVEAKAEKLASVVCDLLKELKEAQRQQAALEQLRSEITVEQSHEATA